MNKQNIIAFVWDLRTVKKCINRRMEKLDKRIEQLVEQERRLNEEQWYHEQLNGERDKKIATTLDELSHMIAEHDEEFHALKERMVAIENAVSYLIDAFDISIEPTTF